jgi:hypothetical protein
LCIQTAHENFFETDPDNGSENSGFLFEMKASGRQLKEDYKQALRMENLTSTSAVIGAG